MARKNIKNTSEKQAGTRVISRYGESEAWFWSRIFDVFPAKPATFAIGPASITKVASLCGLF